VASDNILASDLKTYSIASITSSTKDSNCLLSVGETSTILNGNDGRWPKTKYFLVFDNDTENVIDIVSVVGDNFDGYILSYENKFKFLDEDEEKEE